MRTRFTCSTNNDPILKALFKFNEKELTFAKAIAVTKKTVEAARRHRRQCMGQRQAPSTRLTLGDDIFHMIQVNTSLLQREKEPVYGVERQMTGHWNCPLKNTTCKYCQKHENLEVVCLKKLESTLPMKAISKYQIIQPWATSTEIMGKLTCDFQSGAVYMDDILVSGTTTSAHLQNLRSFQKCVECFFAQRTFCQIPWAYPVATGHRQGVMALAAQSAMPQRPSITPSHDSEGGTDHSYLPSPLVPLQLYIHSGHRTEATNCLIKVILALAANRLAQWALMLSQYQYSTKYWITSDHGKADVFSHLLVGPDASFDGKEGADVDTFCTIKTVTFS
ncbi:hypothetical protein EMCRGX_G007292 [Ephydatia muelleri]